MFHVKPSRVYILNKRNTDIARKHKAINLIFLYLGHSSGTFTSFIFYSFVDFSLLSEIL